MLLGSLLLYALFLILSALFSASETAFLTSNAYTLAHLEKKGSKRARSVLALLNRIDSFLATILIGNTLANTAAASLATSIFVSFMPDKNRAVLLATASTTVLLLFFSEFNPKRMAAAKPHQTAFLLVYPIMAFRILFYPLIKVFTFLSNLFFRRTRRQEPQGRRVLNEEETKIMLASGVKGMSALRKKMISEILDIGSRPVKEIMTPRPLVKAIELDSSRQEILEAVRSSMFTRFPVYRGRLDNIEGVLHSRDIIPYLIDNNEFTLKDVLRKPFFVPESASMEKVMLQLQENGLHLAIVVDEFGNMGGIVTLEDIIEEIVGDIEDEYGGKEEGWLTRLDERTYLIKGAASVKDVNEHLTLDLPEKKDYTTLAGFLLEEHGKIPREQDSLEYRGHIFTVVKMAKQHISLVRIRLKSEPEAQP
ncbi:MAG TPA: hemolysin family protein [Acidobacteriota bacterium]